VFQSSHDGVLCRSIAFKLDMELHRLNLNCFFRPLHYCGKGPSPTYLVHGTADKYPKALSASTPEDITAEDRRAKQVNVAPTGPHGPSKAFAIRRDTVLRYNRAGNAAAAP
jgi:hypothetical protein